MKHSVEIWPDSLEAEVLTPTGEEGAKYFVRITAKEEESRDTVSLCFSPKGFDSFVAGILATFDKLPDCPGRDDLGSLLGGLLDEISAN